KILCSHGAVTPGVRTKFPGEVCPRYVDSVRPLRSEILPNRRQDDLGLFLSSLARPVLIQKRCRSQMLLDKTDGRFQARHGKFFQYRPAGVHSTASLELHGHTKHLSWATVQPRGEYIIPGLIYPFSVLVLVSHPSVPNFPFTRHLNFAIQAKQWFE